MKYVEDPKLGTLSNWLTGREMGDRILRARIETFSCNKGAEDKKLNKQLDQCADVNTNFGSLSDNSVRKKLIDLITTMNASFPDHDFSSITAESFAKEHDLNVAMYKVNRHLSEIAEFYCTTFLEELWSAIDDAISLQECEVYTYVPDMDGDPFSECLWSFNYFFCNKQANKILFFVCMAKNKYSAMENPSGDDEDSSDFEGSDDNDDGMMMNFSLDDEPQLQTTPPEP